MEMLGESSSRKKQSNALKAAEETSGEESDDNKSMGSSEDEEAFLSRRLQRILAKKKYQSGRRYFKKGKDFKKPEVKDSTKAEPICYECKNRGHIKAECPKLKKTEFRKKDNSRKFKKYKKKAMAVAWDNDSDSDSESSSSEEEENANLAFIANIEDKGCSGLGVAFMKATPGLSPFQSEKGLGNLLSVLLPLRLGFLGTCETSQQFPPRRNRSVSPSGSPDPWAAVPTVGSLVGAEDPGARAVTVIMPPHTRRQAHNLVERQKTESYSSVAAEQVPFGAQPQQFEQPDDPLPQGGPEQQQGQQWYPPTPPSAVMEQW
ncbi:hypothetical protein Taro_055212 [Colocasia esculenta]|uniref:CCHC-type domain-containing protein n=1 Tax=Colocasia esculenta TaxID=4460 RepID=A0A843XQQ6_COLES|nr:hypothetical protein [Colocasia esculenta]